MCLRPPELEEKINTLGSAKSYLSEFQDIDPEDRQAVAVLNSCQELLRPEFLDDSEWLDFLDWQNRLSLKYISRRCARS